METEKEQECELDQSQYLYLQVPLDLPMLRMTWYQHYQHPAIPNASQFVENALSECLSSRSRHTNFHPIFMELAFCWQND